MFMYANLYHDLSSSPSDITLKGCDTYVEVKLSTKVKIAHFTM